MFKRCIDECSHCLLGLKGIIDPLEQKAADSRLKVWRSVVTNKKENEIESALCSIEAAKSNLVLCFPSGNL